MEQAGGSHQQSQRRCGRQQRTNRFGYQPKNHSGRNGGEQPWHKTVAYLGPDGAKLAAQRRQRGDSRQGAVRKQHRGNRIETVRTHGRDDDNRRNGLHRREPCLGNNRALRNEDSAMQAQKRHREGGQQQDLRRRYRAPPAGFKQRRQCDGQ
jgi:hypothetical protein